MIALALTVLLAQTVSCPPDEGQIRWSGFTFSAQGQTIEGTLWDRDHNGKPSKGDLFRIDESERWLVLGGALAGAFATRFKEAGRSFAATCESHFEVEGVATVGSVKGLLALAAGEAAGRVDPVEQLQGAMQGWAETLCAEKKHRDENQLADLLVQRAEGTRGLKGSTIRRLAVNVAHDYSLKCAHIAVPQMTFE